MNSNIMRFGDIIVKQLLGIAMCMYPDSSSANLYVTIHEYQTILQFIGSFLFYLRCFITNDFGI